MATPVEKSAGGFVCAIRYNAVMSEAPRKTDRGRWAFVAFLPVLYVASFGLAAAIYQASGNPWSLRWVFHVYDPLSWASQYLPTWFNNAYGTYGQAWIDGVQAVSPTGPTLVGVIIAAIGIRAIVRGVNRRSDARQAL